MLRLTRAQVVAFRAAALHLDQRLSVDELVEGVRPCGLQDTPPGNAVLGLAARVQGLTLEAWAAAVEREKTLVELWAMRGSPIVIATADLPYFTAGLLADDEAALLHAITSGMDVVVAAAGISAADLLDRLSERIGREHGYIDWRTVIHHPDPKAVIHDYASGHDILEYTWRRVLGYIETNWQAIPWGTPEHHTDSEAASS